MPPAHEKKKGSYASHSVDEAEFSARAAAGSKSYVDRARRTAGQYVGKAASAGAWAAYQAADNGNDDGGSPAAAVGAGGSLAKRARLDAMRRKAKRGREEKEEQGGRTGDSGDAGAEQGPGGGKGGPEGAPHRIPSMTAGGRGGGTAAPSAAVGRGSPPAASSRVRRAAQAARSQAARRRAARAAEARRAAAEGTRRAASSSAARRAAAATAKALPVAAPLIVLICVVVAFGIAVGGSSNRTSTDGLGEREARVASYLLGKGLDPLHTAAVMGNVQAESDFDPEAVEVGGGGHGLCQWTGGRYAQLQEYARSKGRPWSDAYAQLDFLWAEMTGEGDAAPYCSVQYDHQGFLVIEDIEEATRYFGRAFERPLESAANWDRRISRARAYYAIMTGSGSGMGSAVVDRALEKLGCPYVWGAAGPDSFDCSGLVVWSYSQAGVTGMGRTTYDQIRQCEVIPESDALPGDLIFMRFSSPGVPEHVGIYMGGGMMVHAPTFGATVTIDAAGWTYSDRVFARYRG